MYETNIKYWINDKGEAKYGFHIQTHTHRTQWKMNCTMFKYKRKFTYSLNLVTSFGSVHGGETRKEGGREKKKMNSNNSNVIWQNGICKVLIYSCALYSDQRPFYLSQTQHCDPPPSVFDGALHAPSFRLRFFSHIINNSSKHAHTSNWLISTPHFFLNSVGLISIV